VSDWMLSNRLQLNTAKTEILWCSTTRRQNHLPSAAVRVGENYVLPLTTVRDLVVLIYRCLHGLVPQHLSDYTQSIAVSNCRHLRSSSSSQLVIRHTQLFSVGDRAFPVAVSGTVCRPTSPQLQRCLFLETASKLISFPNHFLPNCFRFLVLHTVYYCICTLGHSK